MAEFKGKVIEAYFSNNEKDTICVMWNNNETLEEFYVTVDPDAYYFQELLKEVSMKEIEEHTQKRLDTYTDNLQKLVKKWSMAEPKDWDPKSVDKIVNHRIMKLLFEFDKDDKQQQELMFRMKLRIFESEAVKNSTNADGKTMIRKAEEPIEVLMAYAETIGKLGKRVRK